MKKEYKLSDFRIIITKAGFLSSLIGVKYWVEIRIKESNFCWGFESAFTLKRAKKKGREVVEEAIFSLNNELNKNITYVEDLK